MVGLSAFEDDRAGQTLERLASEAFGSAAVDSQPEALVTRRWARSVVRTALAAMPDHDRRAIELAYDEGLTQAEIAARLGWPLGTVKSRTRRALAALRTSLEGVPGLVDGARARSGGTDGAR
jgi:RNA polymerase sigma-70 factor (ECF subfamily)